ncbi:enoyl-CoA hydratase/isomerase family protein [Paraburkholderia sp. MMS20-SJTN17]|uniref:Enoyl-CoA hydratase/isomerase family protein n=1 Tax=Paraburkholderia translucens TaxID=2886945 RepID=A0ABS8K7J6_9BURK|nr:enoyl-CoA hydratase/isomerase family protein [Paraburkholderia sp. MMS20-SJTN17]MCC8400637.1 enoyl-CoA hydratase/isomerase family protein [Paraburkholderia sp. MMS20-SJTN17]
MQYETLKVEVAGAIATVTLNRPDVRNAFNETMIAELTAAFTMLDARDDVRAVVLAANGKAFCAGADLNWMKKMAGYSDDENRADAMRLAGMLSAVYRCNKPVIARVNGDAYAGGMGLIAACDIVVAVDSARFCLSEARLGLIPATIAPYVIRALGEQASRRYFVTAEAFDCASALRLGLVSEAVSAEQLDATVAQLAQTLCANGPQAVRACKRLVQDIAGRELSDALIEDTAARIAKTRAGAEGREGVASFLEKRAPGWRN